MTNVQSINNTNYKCGWLEEEGTEVCHKTSPYRVYVVGCHQMYPMYTFRQIHKVVLRCCTSMELKESKESVQRGLRYPESLSLV